MAAVVLTFVPANDDIKVSFKGARVSKTDAILLGMAYYQASDAEQEALFTEHGGRLLVRSLRAFANYAKRTNQAEVAEVAMAMREDFSFHGTVGEEDGDEDVAV